MKLISVQSRGERIARVTRRLPKFFVHALFISNPFCDDKGWISRDHSERYWTEAEALKAAAEWLREAKE